MFLNLAKFLVDRPVYALRARGFNDGETPFATIAEVVASSGLATWRAEGEGAAPAARALAGRPGVEMLAPFGASFHVSGTDGRALEAAIAPWRGRGDIAWRRIEPTLEDVFIHLMTRSKDIVA